MVLVLTGCPPADEQGSPGDAAPTHQLTQECANADGFSVAYPDGWVTNDEAQGDIPPCSLFDPRSVDTGQSLDVPTRIAVFVRIESVDFEQEPDPTHVDVLSRASVTVDGRPALRIELQHPEGMRTTSYRVDLGQDTVVATTHDAGDVAYEDKQRALDAMVSALSLR